MNWLLDFSDTLVSGTKTWAFEHAFPSIIQQNHLPFDEASFRQITLQAQERANMIGNDLLVLDEMFAQLGWPDHLKKELLRRTFEEFAPTLFEDTIPFLSRLQEAGQRVYLLSNTNDAPQLLENFGIDHYLQQIITPERCGGVAGKPGTALWDCLIEKEGGAILDTAVVVGDDPWSDGAFAEACGFKCWIVDRGQRFTSLHATLPFEWVKSLLEIPI